jgi:hypothetical protein
MATIVRDLFPGPYALPTTAFAAPDVIQGTNFSFPVLRFDAATDENAYFPFRLHNYGSGNITIDLDWYADTASSGDCKWAGRIAAITPNSDADDIEGKAFATFADVTTTHLGTTGQRLHRSTVTLTATDAAVAGDMCWIRIQRDADAAGDTMAGDALLVGATISYSDT